MSSFLCLPIFAGLAVVAPELVPLLFGSRWVAAVPLLQVLCFYGAARVVLAFMHPFMLAKGRAGLYLLLNIILSILTLGGCLIAVRWGTEAIAFSMIASMSAFFAIFLGVARVELDVRPLPLLKSFAFPVLCSSLMVLAVGALRRFVTKGMMPAVAVTICVLTGVVAYVVIALLLRRDLVKAIFEMAGNSLIPSRWRGKAVLSSIENEIEKTTVESAKA
jgi:PST family polysaccharide transporter